MVSSRDDCVLDALMKGKQIFPIPIIHPVERRALDVAFSRKDDGDLEVPYWPVAYETDVWERESCEPDGEVRHFLLLVRYTIPLLNFTDEG